MLLIQKLLCDCERVYSCTQFTGMRTCIAATKTPPRATRESWFWLSFSRCVYGLSCPAQISGIIGLSEAGWPFVLPSVCVSACFMAVAQKRCVLELCSLVTINHLRETPCWNSNRPVIMATRSGNNVLEDEKFTSSIYWKLEMSANAQRDGRPAEYRWRPLFNAAKFGWRPLLECRAVTLPRRETRCDLQGCPNSPKNLSR